MARAAGFGTVVEALGSFWRLTAPEPRLADHHDTVGDRLRCGAGILVDRQAEAPDDGEPTPTDLVTGAWFHDDTTRMDDQQHAISGIARAVPLAEERAG